MSYFNTRLAPIFDAWGRLGVLPDARVSAEIATSRLAAQVFNASRRAQAAQDARSGFPQLRSHFENLVGYAPDLETPKTFNEKLQWRKIHDRDPVFVTLSDKAAAKDWIAERVGRTYLVPTLVRVSSPADLPAGIERDRVVLKCTHTSGRSLFCGPNSSLTRSDVIRRFAQWVAVDYGVRSHEWAYGDVEKAIIAEPILETSDGGPLLDAKLHVFDGVVRLIQIGLRRRDEKTGLLHAAGTVYLNPDWSVSEVRRAKDNPAVAPEKPVFFDEIHGIAETLGAGFDYLRADFLLMGDTFRIGETTLYTSSGMKPFASKEVDRLFGDFWTLPSMDDIRSGALHARRTAVQNAQS